MGSNGAESLVRKVDEATFHDEVFHHAGPVVVTFTGPGCAACRIQKPVLETYARQTGVKVVAVDIAESPNVAVHFDVNALPTTVFVANGAGRVKWSGIMNLRQIEREVADAVRSGRLHPAHHHHE